MTIMFWMNSDYYQTMCYVTHFFQKFDVFFQMSCTKIIIWSAIFINDIWILANPHQNWIVHVWTAKDSWRTLEYSWNDYFGILPTATIQDTSNFKANNHLNRNKSSVLKQYTGLALRASSVRKSAELPKGILVTLNTKILKKDLYKVLF